MALALRFVNGIQARNVLKLSSNIIRNSSVPVIRSSLVCSKSVPTQLLQPVRSFTLSSSKLAAGGSAVGHHTALWTAERILSAGLLGIIPAAFIFPSQGLDALLAISIVMHQHWGLEAIVTDYVRPILFGNVVPKVAHGILLLFSIATLGGLLYFVYNDIGIAKAIRKLWSIKGQ